MRWDELTVEEQESRMLPGYREPASARTFDAPEALDVRFWEVQAKSALNRVPKASAMPFRWTVNPYRGCTHACVYCAAPATPVLMGDGTPRPIGEVVPGDVVYGTVRDGRYRRYARTEVRDVWRTVRSAYRVVLADGTELVTSGDHRFLTERGWKHVVGEMGGRLQRPYLTASNELRGTGGFAAPPAETDDYRRGYLCGMVRGDGHIGSYSYERPNGRPYDVHTFRLAQADHEGLDRTTRYLEFAGVGTRQRVFSAATLYHREVRAVGSQRRDDVDRVEALIRWPLSPDDDWRKGFLAGIFDAEGSAGPNAALRISNGDPMILGWTRDCLTHFGFDAVIEPPAANGCRSVRIRGGLRERLRFFHAFAPAIGRKRDMEGVALKSDADLRVVAIEPLERAMEMVDITTGTGDYVSDGVISHNCFARPTHKYLNLSPGRDFEREIVVKVNAPEVLRAEVMRPRWSRDHVAIGTNTDPYQWVESRYRLMPGIWEALRDSRTPCSVLTKSPLLLRDIGVMKELADLVGFHANLSVPTLDEKVWRATEPHTPHPRKRLEAVAELNRAGIPTGILIAPLMPGINDDPRQVEKILELAAEAGAVDAGGIALHLRGEVREVFMDWLRAYRPDLENEYEQLYARGAYAPQEVRRRLSELPRRHELPGHRPGSALRSFAKGNLRGYDGRGEPPEAGHAPAPAGPEQPTLF